MKFLNDSLNHHYNNNVEPQSKQCPKFSSISSNLRLRISVSSHQGGRKYMEDEYSIVQYQSPSKSSLFNNSNDIMQKSFAFLGIFDGHGGDMAAQYTRQNLCKNIVRQKCFWSDDDDKICLAIHKGFVRTQKEMMKEVEKWPKTNFGLPSTSGTTASVLFIMNGKYYTGHVGDSRIVLGRKTKNSDLWQALPMTRDHKPESPREKNRIEAAGGQVMNKAGIGRVVWNRPRLPILLNEDNKSVSNDETISYDLIPFLSVARSLGDLWSLNKFSQKFVVSPEPDVKCIPIDSDDKCLILASDGLWNMVKIKQAIQVIQDFEEEEKEQSLFCNDDEEYFDNDFEELSPGVIIEPNQSHSLKLLKVCLDRWMNTRFRADNITVLVVMLDQIHSPDNNNFPHFDLDLNQDYNEINDNPMIGDTIHSFNCFDPKQTDENFLEVFKTQEELEIETLMNEILDKFDRMVNNDDKNNPSTMKYNNNNEIELFIDEEQLSLINFSTLSSHHSRQQSENLLKNNDMSTTTSRAFNNFNYSFNIVDHKYSSNNNNNYLDHSLCTKTTTSQAINLTTESNLISWQKTDTYPSALTATTTTLSQANYFSFQNENFTKCVPPFSHNNNEIWLQQNNSNNNINNNTNNNNENSYERNEPFQFLPQTTRNHHLIIDYHETSCPPTTQQEKFVNGNCFNNNIDCIDNQNQGRKPDDKKQIDENNFLNNNTNDNKESLPEKEKIKTDDENDKTQKRKFEQIELNSSASVHCQKRKCLENSRTNVESYLNDNDIGQSSSSSSKMMKIDDKHENNNNGDDVEDEINDKKLKIHADENDNHHQQHNNLIMKQFITNTKNCSPRKSHNHHINELTNHQVVLTTKE